MSTLLALLVLVIVCLFLWLSQGENPRLPRASSPEGKRTRIIAAVLFVVVVATFILDTVSGGLHNRANVLLSLQAIVFAVVVVLIPNLIKMNKMKKKTKDKQGK